MNSRGEVPDDIEDKIEVVGLLMRRVIYTAIQRDGDIGIEISRKLWIPVRQKVWEEVGLAVEDVVREELL